MDDTSGLTKLGSNTTEYKYDSPSFDILETFPNKHGQGYTVKLEFEEFTSLCPKTGQPDFGKIEITYIPDEVCVESKSLKLYFFSWRNQGAFMESIVNTIRDDFVKACDPQYVQVRGDFASRGGVRIIVEAEYGDDD